MANTTVPSEICLISKGLYRIVSEFIGPECVIKQRREQCDIHDILTNRDTELTYVLVTSGSMSEGFYFKTSDADIMYIDKKSIVCSTHTRTLVQWLQSPSLFCMENEECSPGFTLLPCLTCESNNRIVSNALVRIGHRTYLSSKAVRETVISPLKTSIHGPCQSGTLYGTEIDNAFALNCPIWPELAIPFVFRSLESGWPSSDVLQDICNGGCLFVAINSKQQTCNALIDLEWRMSFSLAEKKLIYSMNHSQFLCYGLSKVFLNEVLKVHPPINDLLCSYFMKTAVFWEISERPQRWSSETFLMKFWNVFRRLLKWVRHGYCPNFFIPENNMFYGKIHGENQRTLLSVLQDLYSDGYLCLLRCPSLNESVSLIITQPYLINFILSMKEEYVPPSIIELHNLLFMVNMSIHPNMNDTNSALSALHNISNIKAESEMMRCAVRIRINGILQDYAKLLLSSINISNLNSTGRCNIKNYQKMRTALMILLKTQTFFCMNHLCYAECIYMMGNCRKATDVLLFISRRFHTQSYIYHWAVDTCFLKAISQQGLPFDLSASVMGRYFCTSIEELKIELLDLLQTGVFLTAVPPLVFIHFLLFLCYTRLGANHTRCVILEELNTLLHHDNKHIPKHFKAISWEILGICQQACSDRQAAFQSYINALNAEYNYFRNATIARINSLFD